MLKTCILSVMATFFLLVALDVTDYANAQPPISVPVIHSPLHLPNHLPLSKRARERHYRRQNPKTDWNYIAPPTSPDAVAPIRVPSSPSRSSRPSTSSISNPGISVASRTPGASSSLSDQGDRNNVEAADELSIPAKPKGISPIQIRPAILDMSMPFALVCLSLVVVLAFLVLRGSAAVSNDVRQILLTRSTSPNYKVLHP